MNCQEALDLLYDILDKEAAEIDEHQVHEHLQKCKSCFERYKLEGDVNAFIKEKLSHAQPTVTSMALRSKILGKLDEIDREKGVTSGRKPPFWRTSYTLAAAALLVVMIGAAYLVAGFYRHQDLYIPLERAHWNAEAQLASYSNTTSTQAALDFAESIGYHPSQEAAQAHLIGGHTEEVDGTKLAHFVYSNSDHKVVSVFIAPAAQFDIPDNLKNAHVQRHGIDFFDHNCRGCRLVYHRVGNVVVITATTDRGRELLDFIPGQSVI